MKNIIMSVLITNWILKYYKANKHIYIINNINNKVYK